MDRMTMDIEAVPPTRMEEVVDVLAESFHDYPVMRYVIRDGGELYETRLRALNRFFCQVRYDRDWPVLGISDGDTLVATMLLSEPETEPRSVDVEVAEHDLEATIGPEALRRIAHYEEVSAGIEPSIPAYFVGMLGTRPGYTGRGLGRALLAHAAELAEAHPLAEGVCLATEDPRNVPFYERAGYRVHAEVDIPPIHTWVLWRPNSGGE